jgi:hypothetical protein
LLLITYYERNFGQKSILIFSGKNLDQLIKEKEKKVKKKKKLNAYQEVKVNTM